MREDFFDVFDHLNDEYLYDEVHSNDFHDYFLTEKELEDFLAPSADKWKDVDPFTVKPKLTIDEAKQICYDKSCEFANHVNCTANHVNCRLK